MSNYTPQNLITTTPVENARAIKIGNTIFTGFAEGGSANYYKCASVNTTAGTWTGYLYDKTTHNIASTATTGLRYTSVVAPAVNKIYSEDGLLEVNPQGGNRLIFYGLFDGSGNIPVGTYTPSGSVTYGTDGNKKYIQLNSIYFLSSVTLAQISGDFTFSMWVKYGNSDRSSLFAAYDSDCRIGLDNYYGTYNMWAGNNGWNILESDSECSGSEIDSSGRSTAQLQTNTWQYIAWTRESDTWKLYLNGVLNLTKVRSGTILTGGNLVFNRWGSGDNMISSDVKMSEIKVYKRALSQLQITTQYNRIASQ